MIKKNKIFISLVDLLVEPWSSSKYSKYNQLFSQLKRECEQETILLYSIYFEIPKVNIMSTNILCAKYNLQFHEVPEKLPFSVFENLINMIGLISGKKDRSYTRVVLICSYSLPKRVLKRFFQELLKFHKFHQVQTIYSNLIKRDQSLLIPLIDNYDVTERGLNSILGSINLKKINEEFLFKVASLFLSGKVLTVSCLFFSFCYFLNRNVFPISVESSDYFILSLFQKLKTMFPRFHSFVLNILLKSINEFPLPFVTIHLYFSYFNASQIKQMFATLLRGRGSIKSFLVIFQMIRSKPLRKLYSIAICGRFCKYEIMKKNIHFFKRSLNNLTSLHFELRVLSKVLEIGSYPEFENITFDLLKILQPHTDTAGALSALLKVFFTREKKWISDLIDQYGDKKCNILVALYLMGTSSLVTTLAKMKTRYRSLVKNVIPQLNLRSFTIDCLVPRELHAYLTEKASSTKRIIQYFSELPDQSEIVLPPFDIATAINMIEMFPLSESDIDLIVKKDDNDINDTKNVINKNDLDDINDEESNSNTKWFEVLNKRKVSEIDKKNESEELTPTKGQISHLNIPDLLKAKPVKSLSPKKMCEKNTTLQFSTEIIFSLDCLKNIEKNGRNGAPLVISSPASSVMKSCVNGNAPLGICSTSSPAFEICTPNIGDDIEESSTSIHRRRKHRSLHITPTKTNQSDETEPTCSNTGIATNSLSKETDHEIKGLDENDKKITYGAKENIDSKETIEKEMSKNNDRKSPQLQISINDNKDDSEPSLIDEASLLEEGFSFEQRTMKPKITSSNINKPDSKFRIIPKPPISPNHNSIKNNTNNDSKNDPPLKMNKTATPMKAENRPTMSRPKSMTLIEKTNPNEFEFFSDDLLIDIPSDEYELYSNSDSSKDYSFEGDEIDPNICDDDMVQLFADMFKPNS